MKYMKTKEGFFTEKATLNVFSFSCAYIEAIGYDAQRELLEVRLSGGGRIRRYVNVPEEVWYQFRESADPDTYYRRCICGHFPETAGDICRETAVNHSGTASFCK